MDRQLNKAFSELCETLHIAMEEKQMGITTPHLDNAARYTRQEIKKLNPELATFCERVLASIITTG